MTEASPDSGAELPMQRLALSRWENEGGSFFARRALGGSRRRVARAVTTPDPRQLALLLVHANARASGATRP
jgi:hypothetical protein